MKYDRNDSTTIKHVKGFWRDGSGDKSTSKSALTPPQKTSFYYGIFGICELKCTVLSILRVWIQSLTTSYGPVTVLGRGDISSSRNSDETMLVLRSCATCNAQQAECALSQYSRSREGERRLRGRKQSKLGA